MELIEVVSIKEHLAGKEYYREIVNEFNNVAEVYQLLEEQSPLSMHLLELEEEVESISKGSVKEIRALEMGGKSKEEVPGSGDLDKLDRVRYSNSNDSFEEEEEANEKEIVNFQGSENGSVCGATEQDSKK